MKTYRVIDPDNADRIYTKAVHGFNFKLESGKIEEVNEQEMKLLKEASAFLEFEEVKETPKKPTVFGVAVKEKKVRAPKVVAPKEEKKK